MLGATRKKIDFSNCFHGDIFTTIVNLLPHHVGATYKNTGDISSTNDNGQ